MNVSDKSSSYASGETAKESLLPADAETALRNDAADLAATAKDTLDKVTAEGAAQVESIAEQAKVQVAEISEKAKGLATEQKELLAGQFDGIAKAIEKVAAELESSNASSAGYARMVADGAKQISSTVQNNNVDEILGMAQEFGRKQPVAFMGAAALLGFAASRFVLASAKRDTQDKPVSASAGPDQGSYSENQTSPRSGRDASFNSGRV